MFFTLAIYAAHYFALRSLLLHRLTALCGGSLYPRASHSPKWMIFIKNVVFYLFFDFALQRKSQLSHLAHFLQLVFIEQNQYLSYAKKAMPASGKQLMNLKKIV